MRFRRHEGYSLIELMIVVVIIGLLAAMAIPKFLDSTRKAKEAEAESAVKGSSIISSMPTSFIMMLVPMLLHGMLILVSVLQLVNSIN